MDIPLHPPPFHHPALELKVNTCLEEENVITILESGREC